MGCRASLPGVVVVIALAAAGLPACGGSSVSGTGAGGVVEPLPTRNPHAKAVEPVAGETAQYADLPTARASDRPKRRTGTAQLTNIDAGDGAPTKDAAVSNADVLKNGIALPPIEAPTEVREIIEAGNQIARTPYLWGGGHGKWLDKGYDCSGSISFALANAGLLSGPLDSGRLMSWGEPGPGKWITIYTNPTHVFMVVAGVRFDTSGTRTTGSRWQAQMRPTGGFVVRHPAGL